jgi:lipopolysaccharide/colanic/teichoic acid biosynthesis glycosyltransferase
MMGLCTPLIAVGMILTQALFGAGNTKFVMLVELVLHFFCLVPLAWLFGITLNLGLTGIWASAAGYVLLLTTVMVWKFRSMKTELTDHTASRQVTKNDDRVTRVGRFLRRTSLDELPQLWNVLRGEMSLVGPRPHAIGMLSGGAEASKLVESYAHRHRMKPGLTGWAAVNGSRGPVDTPEAVRRRVWLDLEYVERQSLWLDLSIMLRTLPCVLGDSVAVR